MATPAVSAVLNAPELAAAIDGCTALAPGVPASPETMAALFAYVDKQLESPFTLDVDHPDGYATNVVKFAKRKIKRRQWLLVSVVGPLEWWRNRMQGRVIDQRTHSLRAVDKFEYSVAGLSAGLAWAKQLTGRVARGEYCPRCRVDGAPTSALVTDAHTEPPRKKLRMSCSAYCEYCTLAKALF